MLVFLKLGGSLITNKAGVQQPRRRLMRRLFGEIRASMDANPDLQILLGHGSGSFGHVPASKFGTLQGVHTPEEWQGFSEVWQAAHALNHIVMSELAIAGLPAMAVSPSSAIVSRNREILTWDISPIQAALSRESCRLSSVTRSSTKLWAGRSYPPRTSSSTSPPACTPRASFSPGRKRESGRIFRKRNTWFRSSPRLP